MANQFHLRSRRVNTSLSNRVESLSYVTYRNRNPVPIHTSFTMDFEAIPGPTPLLPSPIKVDIKNEIHSPLSVAFTEAASVLSDDELPICCDLLTLSHNSSPCENPMQSVESLDLLFPASTSSEMTPLTATGGSPVDDLLLLTDDEDQIGESSLLCLDSVSPVSTFIESPEVLLLELNPSSSQYPFASPENPLVDQEEVYMSQEDEGNNNYLMNQRKTEDDDDDEDEEEYKYTCKDCGMKFCKAELYEIHLSGHANNLRCELCRASLKSFKNYEKHRLKCKPFECGICGKIVRFRPNYLKHLKVHERQEKGEDAQESKPKFKCEVCEKEFTSAEYFRIHQKTHLEGVDLQCKICLKTFSAVACLRSHAKVHTGEKRFRCETCGKGFAQSYNLKVHRRMHSGEKPFECPNCGKRSTTMASHQTHLKTHKQFKCELCNETFDQKIKYMSHMSQHETGKVLECSVCNKKFGRPSNFYNHQRLHLGIKKFKCYICGQAFVKAASLDAHLITHCSSSNKEQKGSE